MLRISMEEITAAVSFASCTPDTAIGIYWYNLLYLDKYIKTGFFDGLFR